MQVCHRLFFALQPPIAEARRMGLIRDALGAIGTPVANERLHVTLGITNDYATLPHDLVHRARQIGDSIAGDPFALCLDRLSAGARSVAVATGPCDVETLRKSGADVVVRDLSDTEAFFRMLSVQT